MWKQIHILSLVKKLIVKIFKFKIGYIFRISKYKNIFAKGCNPYSPDEVFVNKKFKNTDH